MSKEEKRKLTREEIDQLWLDEQAYMIKSSDFSEESLRMILETAYIKGGNQILRKSIRDLTEESEVLKALQAKRDLL